MLNTTKTVLLAYPAIALIVFMWMFRYDVVSTATGTVDYFLTDRWTGKVYICAFIGCRPFPEKH